MDGRDWMVGVMGDLHIYGANKQLATDYSVSITLNDGREETHRFRSAHRSLVRTRCCNKRRWAGRCVVQVYYDDVPMWCAEGYGCKR